MAGTAPSGPGVAAAFGRSPATSLTCTGRPRFRACGPALLGGGGAELAAGRRPWRGRRSGVRLRRTDGALGAREDRAQLCHLGGDEPDLIGRELLAVLRRDLIRERLHRVACVVDLGQQAVLRAAVQR